MQTRIYRFRAALLALVLVIAVVIAAELKKGSYSGPSCRPHSHHCEQTLDDHWVPSWYYEALQRAQNAPYRRPVADGAQPSVAQLRAAGASAQEIARYERGRHHTGVVIVTRVITTTTGHPRSG